MKQPLKTVNKSDTQILEMIVERVRLRSRRRLAWLRHLWDRGGDPFSSEIDFYLEAGDDSGEEEAWYSSQESLAELNRRLEELEKTLKEERHSSFKRLINIFGLNEQESDLLQICLSLALDERLASVFGFLRHQGQGNGMNGVSGGLAARLFGYGRSLLLTPPSPLKIWDMVRETFDNRGGFTYECDPDLVRWLSGLHELPESLFVLGNIRHPRDPLPGWPLAETSRRLASLLEEKEGGCIRVRVTALPGAGRRSFAALICRELGMPLLVMESRHIPPEKWEHTFVQAQRYAFLKQCALGWLGDAALNYPWPRQIPWFPLQFLFGESAPLASQRALDLNIQFPSLLPEEQERLWQRFFPPCRDWDPQDFESFRRSQSVTPGQMLAAAEQGLSGWEEVREFINQEHTERLIELASPLECPFHWGDLIVEEGLKSVLEDFLFEAQRRAALWEDKRLQRLFPQGRGLLALFTGPPGTGKTMTAQVLASRLNLELFRVDLSSVVSKYVGETSKNIKRILKRAAAMNVMILFDEADALFGKRTEIKDAHDRFANTDTNYLLQAIEEYPGIALLASNRKANLDEGFIRRLRYVVNFSKPDACLRQRIWKQLVLSLTDQATADSLGPVLNSLGLHLDLTGAQIKFALLSALFSAQRLQVKLSLALLLAGIKRELNKEGRGISRREEERLLKEVSSG